MKLVSSTNQQPDRGFSWKTLRLLYSSRQIEARIVGPIFDAFAKEVGVGRARKILTAVIRNLATNAPQTRPNCAAETICSISARP